MALVIVLAFVVLLTGLIVAFFSRSLSELQLSNGSVSQMKVDALMQGAVDTIVSDLKQEIFDSTTNSTLTSTAGGTLYLPKQDGNGNYPSMVPARDPALSGKTGMENLIKRSATVQPFTGNKSKQAAGPSTLIPSLNNHYVSPSRWNSHFLLQKDSAYASNDTNFTPTGATPATATANATWSFAPDWVVVTRDGSNPAAWNPNLRTSAANSTSAVGRYAYAIYDEGGLLDMNAVGYPADASSLTAVEKNVKLAQRGSKAALAFADLKQLPGIKELSTSGSPSAQDQIIDGIIGFRNFASAAYNSTSGTQTVLGGTFPSLTWAKANADNYYQFALSTTAGFLRAPSNVPTVTSSVQKTDHPFVSRQELLRTLLQLNSADRANLQNALPYLTHFSRALDQPSLAPDHTKLPSMLPLANGGNDQPPSGKNYDDINPVFLKIRVPGTDPSNVSFTRNDGTPAYETEPLVKKRFALNRLAWLTYKGPSKDRTGTDITDLLSLGVTQAFLDQGIDNGNSTDNIEKYFGLKWDTRGFWTYNVHTNGAIKTLSEVAAAKREPDFIELLKASITAGALGKSGAQGTSPDPAYVQYIRDSALDYQVIQIAANIIDQADVDGYPTRIQFAGQEIRGVENLPYLYRVRNGLYRIVNPTTTPSIPQGATADWFAATMGTGAGAGGAFIMVQQPEIWNPHSYNTGAVNRSLGNPRPSNLQLVVYGAPPALPPLVPSVPSGTSTSVFPLWQGTDGGTASTGAALTDANTKMTFSTGNTLYREPTLLIKPNVPTNSNLQAPGFVAAATADGLKSYTGGGGITVLDSLAMAYGTTASDEPGVQGSYCGIYLGKNVVGFPGKNAAGTTDGVRVAGQAHYVPGGGLTYQIQCDSATGSGMDTYDEKYFSISPDHVYTDGLPPGRGMLGVSTSDADTYSGRLIIGASRVLTCFDPRTSRFGFMATSTATDSTNYQSREFPPGARSPGSPRWVEKTNNVLPSNRPDANAGYGFANPNFAPPSSSLGWKWDNQLLRFGLFSQNSFSGSNDNLRFYGDNGNTPSNGLSDKNAQYYQDCDGIVRRGMAANVSSSSGTPASSATGLPMVTAFYLNNILRQRESRPIVLNRPFRVVGDLGNVFSGTPWKNLDLSTPESGFSPLLDVFCINDTDNAEGMVAGKVNLNTRQSPVLQAVLAGAYRDEYNPASTTSSTVVGQLGTGTLASETQTIADTLVSRTSSANNAAGKGPLTNVSDLVGRWVSGTSTSAVYDGLSSIDLNSPDTYVNNISRYREAPIRALVANGQTRVWSLMIDVIAQTGRYPTNIQVNDAKALEKFVVEGEQRCWVHVAIDRLTGKVIDKQVEVVKE